MGTVSFRVSMANRAASNASGRWGADTATTTAASVSATSPTRCNSAIRPSIGQRRRSSSASSRSFGPDLFLVGLVLEPAHARATIGVVADGAGEDHDGPALGQVAQSSAAPAGNGWALRPSHSSAKGGASRSDTAVMLLTLVADVDLNSLGATGGRRLARGPRPS